MGADDSKIDPIIKGHWSAVHLVPQAYFATQPHVGERLLSDEGQAVLLFNIEKGVAVVKWYHNPSSFYYRLPSASCWTLERRVRSTWATLPHMASQKSDQRPKRNQCISELLWDKPSESPCRQLVDFHSTRGKKTCQHFVNGSHDAYLYRILTCYEVNVTTTEWNLMLF